MGIVVIDEEMGDVADTSDAATMRDLLKRVAHSARPCQDVPKQKKTLNSEAPHHHHRRRRRRRRRHRHRRLHHPHPQGLEVERSNTPWAKGLGPKPRLARRVVV